MSFEFQLFSDIHLELKSHSDKCHISPKAKYLFLAGDIGNIKNPNYIPFLEYCSSNWDKIIYVFGNHEFYNRHSMETIISNTYEIISKFSNIYLLNNSYVEIDDFIIYGMTGWTRCTFSTTRQAQEELNDYKYISTKNGRFTLSYQNLMVNENIELFKNFINEHTINEHYKKIIVVTHFPPIQQSTRIEPNINLKNYFAWNNLLETENINGNNIVCWMSGHTHESFDIIHNNIRYINNPIGYSGEDTGFITDKFCI